MSFDVFISYCWTNPETKEFVHGLAAHLKHVGFNVGVDIDVDYGDSLTGFMNEITMSKHVLLVADGPYVERANSAPGSGVGIENEHLRSVFHDKKDGWLAVALVGQRSFPEWLAEENPKSFIFDLEGKYRYGSAQIDSLWRWLSDMPANNAHAVHPSVIKERLWRVESVEAAGDPSRWACPLPAGAVRHEFKKATGNNYRVGYGEHEFFVMVTEAGARSVYLYKDPISAVGLIPPGTDIDSLNGKDAFKLLVPGRTVTLVPGSAFVLMNKQGALCVGSVLDIHCPSDPFKQQDSFIEFEYRILLDE